jgi:hypothetical protein
LVPLELDLGSKGLGPAYRSLMTFGEADDLVYEFATNRIATPAFTVSELAASLVWPGYRSRYRRYKQRYICIALMLSKGLTAS